MNNTFTGLNDRPRASAVSPKSDPAVQDGFLDILQIIWRAKWSVFAIALLPLFLSGYYAFEMATPQYMARVQLALDLDSQNSQIADVASIVSSASTESSAINTELQIMRTRKLIGAVVDELNLVNEPAFNPTLAPISRFDRLRIRLGLLSSPATLPEAAQRSRTINSVRRAVSTISRRGTYILEIRATTPERRLSIDIANSLAEMYIREQIAIKFQSTEFAVDWLSERVTELEAELFEKEESLKEQRASTEIIDEVTLNALLLRAKDLRSHVERLDVGIDIALLEQLRAVGDREAIVAQTNDSTLRNLLRQIDQANPQAEEDFDQRLNTLIAIGEADRQKRETLEQSLAELDERVQKQSRDLTTLTQMERDADATRVLYQTFLARLKEASLQIGFQRADSYVMESAHAASLIAPNPPLLLAMGMVMGLLFGTTIVVLRQKLQRGIKTVSELEQTTGISVLGQVPVLPIRRRSALVDYLLENPTSGAVEAIRNLRTSILLSDIDNPPQIILSTSSVPGEGKTTHAVALASMLSSIDKKVLLLGADIRRLTITEYFKDVKDCSLMDVAAGTTPLEDVVCRDERTNIDLLTDNSKSMNPANLFSSGQFRNLLETLRDSYDFIVIDTPPLLLVPDTRILAQYSDVVVMSVKWNQTTRAQVKEGLRQLSTVGVSPAGLVISQINPRKLEQYSYGTYYGYGTGEYK